jgi:hypothetical protein
MAEMKRKPQTLEELEEYFKKERTEKAAEEAAEKAEKQREYSCPIELIEDFAGCNIVPPSDARTRACSTYSTPFEQALLCNNIAKQMVRASFVTAEVANEWRSRTSGSEYALERNGEKY